ncbi:hypothetical protein XU18_2725 [Perkinsela sp. CCAP 1560/4]|nr:hypothetical protein XU18_2725 [Perkinsela sp. CCAP 1560/4]|eukprot:KNH06220.1 hypothetical protein XU18_2725 [Perkinsela sp. CCAP 1560/4]
MTSPSHRRVCVPIVGGLGNQMFLIATGVATAIRNRADLIVPHVEQSDSCAEPRPVYWKTMFQSISPYMRFVDGAVPRLIPAPCNDFSLSAHTTVIPESAPAKRIVLPENAREGVLRGFFQSPAYFDDCRQHVVDLLVPDAYVRQASSALHCNARASENSPPRRTVGIHIRRGDYLTMRDTFPILSVQDYYLPALERLLGAALLEGADCARTLPLRVVIFTEDAVYGELFRDMLRCKYPLLAANPDCVSLSNIQQDYIEMLAMSLCDDLIIANSSFSWWGAYLNSRPLRRVIAPSKWFVGRSPNIYCDDWQRI